jgi:uncharacterized damage-inducible protein DinB/catechol 2,3-dioxygenase-like lactoylglutathione lyase family enzyme
MAAITQVYETILYAPDLDSAERFYAGALGLPALPRMGDRGVAFRVTGDSVLIVFDASKTVAPHDSVPSHGATGEGHVAFTVSDLDPWRARLRERGVPIEREVEWPLGGRSLYVRDPARNSVELVAGKVWAISPSEDPLDLLLRHDAGATRRLLDLCTRLSDEQWHRRFDIGPGSLHDTLTHVVGAMLRWADRIDGPDRPLRPSIEDGTHRTPADLRAMLDLAAADLASSTARARSRGLSTPLDVTLGGTPYRFTLGAMLVHVTTHGTHHRAQCLNMLRRLAAPGISDALPDLDVLECEWTRGTPPAES